MQRQNRVPYTQCQMLKITSGTAFCEVSTVTSGQRLSDNMRITPHRIRHTARSDLVQYLQEGNIPV